MAAQSVSGPLRGSVIGSGVQRSSVNGAEVEVDAEVAGRVQEFLIAVIQTIWESLRVLSSFHCGPLGFDGIDGR